MSNVIRNTMAASVFALAAAVTTSWAQDSVSTVVFTGADATEFGWGTYLGAVHALNGDIGSSGWTTTVILGYSHYNDDNSVPPSSGDTLTASVLAGYLWHGPGYYMSLSAGVDMVDNTESPSTGSVTEGTHFGGIVQIGFETTSQNAPYFNGFGTYMTANERFYTQLRAGYRGNQYAFGLEAVYSDELASNESTRLGVFLSGIPLGRGELGFSVGYLDERGGSNNDSPYFAVEYSVPIQF